MNDIRLPMSLVKRIIAFINNANPKAKVLVDLKREVRLETDVEL